MDISGYGPQKIDFPEVLSQQVEGLQNLFHNDVLVPLADAEMVPEAGKFCVVTIIGHSDRVDTPGLTSEQRRAEELSISQLRAESAQAFLLERLFALVQEGGGVSPVDLSSIRNGAILTIAAGAADLTHTVPQDESQRKENRRVAFLVATFNPAA